MCYQNDRDIFWDIQECERNRRSMLLPIKLIGIGKIVQDRNDDIQATSTHFLRYQRPRGTADRWTMNQTINRFIFQNNDSCFGSSASPGPPQPYFLKSILSFTNTT